VAAAAIKQRRINIEERENKQAAAASGAIGEKKQQTS